jgi:aspartyl-tRNA(Asn)/glutamyl-tRNA(Gln) amidotransferase subunit B
MRIGLEVHIQLSTRTKLLCPCPVKGEGNENVCPTCLGFPGSRPALNVSAVRQGLLIARILGSGPLKRTQFSRKSYFYPDLPKSFQVTQFEAPLAMGGEIAAGRRGELRLRVQRLQLEEDPARIVYDGENVLLDHSRCGAPLLEVVTEPDLSTPAQAREVLEWLEGVLGAEGGAGAMRGWRCDANISLESGERVEIKNISGAKGVERALAAEEARQREVVASGGRVERETRLWDEGRGVTVASREKETEADYGYIPEPDIPPVSTRELLGDDTLRPEELERLQKIALGGPRPSPPPTGARKPRTQATSEALSDAQVGSARAALLEIARTDPKAVADAKRNERAFNALVGRLFKRLADRPDPRSLAEWLKRNLP